MKRKLNKMVTGRMRKIFLNTIFLKTSDTRFTPKDKRLTDYKAGIVVGVLLGGVLVGMFI